jgi:hypothetical protein
MILLWNDVKSFNRHLESMKRFHQRHQANEKKDWNLIKDMPMMRGIHVSLNAGGAQRHFGANSYKTVVPLWKFTLPGNSQN